MHLLVQGVPAQATRQLKSRRERKMLCGPVHSELGILHHWEQLPFTDATPELPTYKAEIKFYKF
jgi:hypothetical protein